MFRTLSLSLAMKLAVAGILVLLAGILWSALHFPGGFRPICNFVSELGWKQHSPGAWAFNAGLTLSSLLLFPVMNLLGKHLDTRTARGASGVGLVTMLSAAALGFAPMDYLLPHIILALLFFFGWLLTVILFAMALSRGNRLRDIALLMITSVISVLLCAVFLGVVLTGLYHAVHSRLNLKTFIRPPVWDIAILEWCVVASLFVWVLAAARYLHSASAGPSGHSGKSRDG